MTSNRVLCSIMLLEGRFGSPQKIVVPLMIEIYQTMLR